MADLTPLIHADDIKTDLLLASRRQGQWAMRMSYDDVLDALKLTLFPDDEETSVYFIDSYVGFLYRVDSLELIGILIEDFEQGYLQSLTALQRQWVGWRQTWNAGGFDRPSEMGLIAFNEMVISILKSLRETRAHTAANLIAAIA